MQQNERRLIEELFARLRGAEGQNRDPEIEQLIAAEMRRVPNAPYAMAQTIIAQNQALEAAAARIEELENGEGYDDEEGEPARGAMGAPSLGRRGSVPTFGRGAGMRGQPMQGQPAQGQAMQGQAMQGQGGGFLANAGQVALGVAGGMLLGEAAKSLLGSGSEAQAATGAADTTAASGPLSQDAGVDDVDGGTDENGGGLFGWLFGGGSQDNDADHGGDWDGGGDSDSGGD